MRRRAYAILAALIATATAWGQAGELRTVHVFLALADNQHQGIVPVAPILGNGDDPQHNLYWGSAYGVKAFFGLGAGFVWRKAEGGDS